MKGVTVKYRAQFGKRPTEKEPAPDTPAPPSRVARMLALAYWVERQVDSGRIRDYDAAARVIGVSRARMSQILALLNLAPRVQEGILTGKSAASERQLRSELKRTP